MGATPFARATSCGAQLFEIAGISSKWVFTSESTFDYWLENPKEGDGGDFCDAPSASVVLPRGNWKFARPRCSEYIVFNSKYWITVDWELAHRIQTQIAAIEVLEEVAYWAKSDALSGLVGDAETFSRAAEFLTEMLQSILPARSLPTQPSIRGRSISMPRGTADSSSLSSNRHKKVRFSWAVDLDAFEVE